jgi:hypothetical protein
VEDSAAHLKLNEGMKRDMMAKHISFFSFFFFDLMNRPENLIVSGFYTSFACTST